MARGRSISRGKGTPDGGGSSKSSSTKSSSSSSSGSTKKTTSYLTDKAERAAGGSVSDRITGGGSSTPSSSPSTGSSGGKAPTPTTSYLTDQAERAAGGSVSDRIMGVGSTPHTPGRSAATPTPAQRIAAATPTPTPHMPGQPDLPGEARAKMIVAGVTVPTRQATSPQIPDLFKSVTAGSWGLIPNIELLSRKSDQPTPEPKPSVMESIHTAILGGAAAKEIAERRSQEKARTTGIKVQKTIQREFMVADLKEDIGKIFSPVTTSIRSIVDPWYSKQEKTAAKVTATMGGTVQVGDKADTWAYKAHQKAQRIRDLQLPQVTGATTVAEYARESVARHTEGIGGMPTLLKYGLPPLAHEVVKAPAVVVPLVAVAGVSFAKAVYHDPIQSASDVLMFPAAGKAAKISPIKIKPTVISFPEAKGISFGLELRRSGVTTFKPGVTVMPRAEKLITVGTPKVIETAIIGKTPFTPKTALEANIVARSLGREGAKITEALAVRRATTKAKVPIKEITPTIEEVLGHHGISKASAPAVLDITKAHKGTVFGSIIQRAAGEGGLTRVPRDFDIVVKDPVRFAKDIATRINEAEGRRAAIAKDGTVTTWATGKKLFDIHAPDTAPKSYFGRTEIGFGLIPEKLIKPEGLRMRSFSEQMSRKLEGGMIVGETRSFTSPLGSVTGRIVPKHEGRIKDILDFYTGEKIGIKRLRTQGKTKSATKADTHLEKWLDLWGPEVAANVRDISTTQIKAGVPTKIVFDFDTPPRISHKSTTYPATAAAAYTRTPSSALSTPPSALAAILPASVLSSVPPSVQPYKPASAPPSALAAILPASVPLSVPPPVQPYKPASAPLPALAPILPASVPPVMVAAVPTYIPLPPPRVIVLPKKKKKEETKKRRAPKRGAFDWSVKNPLREFFGSPKEQSKDLQKLLGIPATTKRRSAK